MKRISERSIAATIALAFTGTVNVCAATELPFTVADVHRVRSQVCSGIVEIPCRPAIDDVIGYYAYTSYEGLACRCIEPEKISISENSGVTVRSYAEYLSYRNDSEYPFDSENMPLELPDWMDPDELYILSAINLNDELNLKICQENPVLEPIGIMTAYIMSPTYYWGIKESPLWIEASEGYEIDADAVILNKYRLSNQTDWCNGCWYPVDKDTGEICELNLEEVNALCEALEAREDIAFAWVHGTTYAMEFPSSIQEFAVVEVEHQDYNLGDVDNSGNIELNDALQVLHEYADTILLHEDSTMTDMQIIAADFNQDGLITMEDALEILRYYARHLAAL